MAAGQAVAIVPAVVPEGGLRPDLAMIPLRDVEPSHVVLARRADDHSRLVTAFATAASSWLTGIGPANRY